MSVFSNPASHSLEQARAYTAAILDLLGTNDPISVLNATSDALKHAVDRLTEQAFGGQGLAHPGPRVKSRTGETTPPSFGAHA